MSTIEAGRVTRSEDRPNEVDLQSLVYGSPKLDELSTARLIGQLAGLVHAARGGGKPTDLSPDKIVIAADGTVRIDAVGANGLAYSSPEKIKNVTTDRRSDVFALGVVMWEALVHARLFDGNNDDAVKTAITDQEIDAVSSRNANIPAELSAICKKALSRDPAERYASPKVMAAEIEAVLDEAGYPDDNARIASFMTGALARQKPKTNGTNGSNGNLKATMIGHAIRDATPAFAKVEPPAPAAPVVAPPAPAPKPVLETPNPDVATATRAKASTPPANERSKSPSQIPSIKALANAPSAVSTLPGAAGPVASQATISALPPLSDTLVDRPILPTTPVAPVVAAPVVAAPVVAAPVVAAPVVAAPVVAAPVVAAPVVAAPVVAPPVVASPVAASSIVPAAAAFAAVPSPPVVPAAPVLPTSPKRLDDMAEMVKTTPFERVSALPPPSGSRAPVSPARTIHGLALGPIPGSDEALAAEGAPTPMTSIAPPAPILAATTTPPAVEATPTPTPMTSIAPPTPLIATVAVAPPPPTPTPPPTPQVATAAAASSIADLPTAPTARQRPGTNPFDESGVHPANAVSLPRATTQGTGKHDVLAKWAWTNGESDAPVDDEDYHANDKPNKKLIYAIGGGVGLVLIIMIIAFASGGSKDVDKAKAEADLAAAAAHKKTEFRPTAGAGGSEQAATPDPTVPATNGSSDPIANPGSNSTDGTKVDEIDPKAAAAAEKLAAEKAAADKAIADKAAADQAAADKAAADKALADQAAADKAIADKAIADKAIADKATAADKAAAAKAEKAAAAKAAADKLAADKAAAAAKKLEAKKLETKKAETKKAETKKTEIKKTETKKTTTGPIDPYAETTTAKKIDPVEAYRTGLQQYARGDTSGALATFKASAASNGNFAPTYRGLGLVYEKLGNRAAAKNAFKRYLALAPNAGDSEDIKARMEKL